MFCGLDGNMIF